MFLSKTIIIALVNLIVVVYSQTACNTPNGEQGVCVPLRQCRVLLNKIYDRNPQTRQFIRQSQCSYGRYPNVCCGSVAEYTRQQYQKQKPSSQTSDPKRHRNIKLLPRSGYCGQQSLQDKLVGGTEAGLDEFPWLALLGYKKDGQDQDFHCGGSLINDRYVLTAAHCVTGSINRFYGEVYKVRLGEHDIRTRQDCTNDGDCNEPPQDLIIEEAVFHTGYIDNSLDRYHDIALLRLKNPVRLSYFIQPICLPLNGEETTPGTNMSIAGWGKTENETRSNVKLKAMVPYVDPSQCNIAYTSLRISRTQLCAGGQKGVDSCNGDSGGPIMNLLADRETWYAEGLVSFGPTTCGTENLPGVYTRIYYYLNWILDNIRP